MKLLQHFKELTIKPKNAQELKGLILQLAIQGKLTANWREENPDVEPASKLYEHIELEKEKLIEQKIIKKEKKLTQLNLDEIPYEIPQKWNWHRLDELSSINGGFAFKSSNYIDEGARVIRISDFDENGFKNHKIVRHTYSDALESYVLEDKNILIAMTGGTVGKSLFVDKVPEVMVVNQRVATIKILKPIYEAYINCVIPTKLIQDVIEEAKNSTNDNISMSNIKGFKIPLPPFEEQKEIVKIVETLFKEVEQLEQLTVERISLKEDFVTSALHQLTTNNAKQEWAFLQKHFKSFFNETHNLKKLRETVLQLAVQGKLTADWRQQRLLSGAEVEDASILLKRIQKEKAQLIKDKKIKKEKALPPITKEEIPYELPPAGGWVWCRFQNIINDLKGGGTPSKRNPSYWGGNLPWASVKDLKDFRYLEKTQDFITKDGLDNSSANLIPVNSLIICTRMGLGKIVINKIPTTINQDLKAVSLSNKVNIEFIYDQYKTLSISGSGMTVSGIKEEELLCFLFALPPLEEQKAIVEKVNALMGLCDRLEQEVAQSQEHSKQLMQSVLREVFQN